MIEIQSIVHDIVLLRLSHSIVNVCCPVLSTHALICVHV